MQGLLQGDASLLPMLSALAADKAKRGGVRGGGYDVHAVRFPGQDEQAQQVRQHQHEAMPSLLLQLFASLEQQRRPGSGQQAQQAGGGLGPPEEAGGGEEGVGERPSWIPSGLFGGQVRILG